MIQGVDFDYYELIEHPAEDFCDCFVLGGVTSKALNRISDYSTGVDIEVKYDYDDDSFYFNQLIKVDKEEKKVYVYEY